jgi:nicotinamide-nucleotide amidase
VRCEVLAVGTELLLGQVVDTNSAWIGEQLAAVGIDSYVHVHVGDNRDRLVEALRSLLASTDSVLVCGGLGPTQDDLTREGIAEVMGVGLRRDEDLVDEIRNLFMSRGRSMPANNLRQADVPEGAQAIRNALGTAPGLICPVGSKVVYAVPGVPYEMQAMVRDSVLPDLLERAGERSTIVSRTLKTWGMTESALAERVAPRVDIQTNPTIAFLARGIEGLQLRITAKASGEVEARKLIQVEEAALRDELGSLVYGVDDETMESVVLDLLCQRNLTVGAAESLTGGLVGARLTTVAGSGDAFMGSIVSYHTDVKRSLLGVTTERVVSAECAKEMARAARRVLGADVGVSTTGVAGPDELEGQPVGTVWFGLALPGRPAEAAHARMPGDRERIRQFSTISLLNLLRLRILDLDGSAIP